MDASPPVNIIENIDAMSGMAALPDGSIDMIMTDPPYGISYLSPRTTNHRRITGDDESFDTDIVIYLREFLRVLKNNSVCCVCMVGGGKRPVSQKFVMAALSVGFNLVQEVVWDKMTLGLGWRYRPSYEKIIVLSKNKKYNFYSTSHKISNIVRMNNIIPRKGDHPTPKPVQLMEFFINLHSKEGDIILDPFAGHATTAIAAVRNGRRYICYEIDSVYYGAAVSRVNREIPVP
ncbi:MAG TPA: site-specific DNA-methyltransferase [Anaerolineae bacterium]